MFSGLPFLKTNIPVLSTHHLLNSAVYKKIKPKEVSLEAIQYYSGYYGPDGEFFRHVGRASDHAYNPETKEGGALKQIYTSATKAMTSLTREQKERAAYHMARVAHFIVDALTPVHQVGRMKPSFGVYDWEDPRWDYRNTWDIFNAHLGFELKAALALPFRIRRIASCITPVSLERAKELVHYLKEQCHKVHAHDLLSVYKKRESITKPLCHKIFPTMIECMLSAFTVIQNSGGKSPKKSPSTMV